MSFSPGYDVFKLAYEISPIVLNNGIAVNMPGGALPIVVLTESPLASSLLTGTSSILSLAAGAAATLTNLLSTQSLDDFFAHWLPLPGSSLIDQAIGKYPFANQAIAANAVIRQPLTISMRMICPANGTLGYAVKLATISALQTALAQHNVSGGTYTVITPSYFYTNCLLTGVRDTSNAGSKQTQNTYQFDFEQPLLTLQDAAQAYNNTMSQLANGTQMQGINGGLSWSGVSQTTGNPASLGLTGLSPSATTPAANVSAATVGANQAAAP